MAISDRELMEAFERIDRRLDNLEGTLRRIEGQEGRWNQARELIGPVAHLSATRAMFLFEVLRAKGLISDVDVSEIAEKVTDKLAGDDIPWGVGPNNAKSNVATVEHELRGDYQWDPQDERDS